MYGKGGKARCRPGNALPAVRAARAPAIRGASPPAWRAGPAPIRVRSRGASLAGEIAPALERAPRPRLDRRHLRLQHDPAAPDTLLVDERAHRQHPLAAHHLPADHPVERAAADDLVGALGHHARGVDVLGLLAARAPALLLDPVLEVLDRVAADAELDEMQCHADTVLPLSMWQHVSAATRTWPARAAVILRERLIAAPAARRARPH